MKRGVLVASDERQEWLLPWWWKNYTRHNSLPVCFIDLGMSENAKSWCEKRGEVVPISIETFSLVSKEEIPKEIQKDWEGAYWETRKAWFKKPFALLSSPFDQTLWLDLDCEVIAPIEEIYTYLKSQFALFKVRDLGKGKSLYNSGVIVYEKNTPVLKHWVETTLKENGRFFSDQDILSEVIFQKKIKIDELPVIYNWQMCRGVSLYAKILHWSATWGKEYIRKFKLSDKANKI